MERLARVDDDVIWDAIDPSAVVNGTPAVGHRRAGTLHGIAVGIWEMTAGSAVDVEVDEIFVVTAGRATLSGAAGEFEIGAGDMIRLERGEHTTWTVHEPLRKVYITGVG